MSRRRASSRSSLSASVRFGHALGTRARAVAARRSLPRSACPPRPPAAPAPSRASRPLLARARCRRRAGPACGRVRPALARAGLLALERVARDDEALQGGGGAAASARAAPAARPPPAPAGWRPGLPPVRSATRGPSSMRCSAAASRAWPRSSAGERAWPPPGGCGRQVAVARRLPRLALEASIWPSSWPITSSSRDRFCSAARRRSSASWRRA